MKKKLSRKVQFGAQAPLHVGARGGGRRDSVCSMMSQCTACTTCTYVTLAESTLSGLG